MRSIIAMKTLNSYQLLSKLLVKILVGQFLFNSHRGGGGGVQLGPLGTSATEWPIVPAPSDYDDGEFGTIKISR
jgi:hypothetical protein